MRSEDTPAKPLSREEIERILPATISDLKHSSDPKRRERTNANIHRDLYMYVIREMYSEDRFLHTEPVPPHREGLFIKGYVRDVWSYLDEAYDLIHGIDFETEYADLIRTVS